MTMRTIEDIETTATYPACPNRAERSVMREGVVAGTFAAAGVAAAFSTLDAVLAEPLFTPTLLGSGLGRLLGIGAMSGSTVGAVVGYALFHVAAFIALATIVAAIVRRARRDARELGAALLVLAIVELAFYGFVALLAQTSYTASQAWPQLVTGNVLGWVLLGAWQWRTHPELGGEFTDAVRGTEPTLAH
jgi:ABC-type Fe3+-siderophore transport system permease subunit